MDAQYCIKEVKGHNTFLKKKNNKKEGHKGSQLMIFTAGNYIDKR